MTTEKLTLESVVGRIQWDEVLTANTNKDNLDRGKNWVITLLEQIKCELLSCSYHNSSKDIVNCKTIVDVKDINEVFTKYLK